MFAPTVNPTDQVTSIAELSNNPTLLVQKLQELDNRKKSIDASFQEYHSKLGDLQKREDVLKEVQSKVDDIKRSIEDRAKKLEALEADLKAKKATLGEEIVSKDSRYSVLASTLASKEQSVNVREAALLEREKVVARLHEQHQQLHEGTMALKSEYEAKVAKLKELI